MSNPNEEKCTLPSELIAIGVLLSGELAWSAEDSLRVIRWLADAGYAVVGVELWEEDNGFPKWIASSDYSYDEVEGWEKYCQSCKDAALWFIENAVQKPKLLFNLSWISPPTSK